MKGAYRWSGNYGEPPKRIDPAGKIKRTSEDAPKDIRSLAIPSQSALAARLGKIVNSKQSGGKKP